MDKRKIRRGWRRHAKNLVDMGTFLNPGRAPVGSIPWVVAQYFRKKARNG